MSEDKPLYVTPGDARPEKEINEQRIAELSEAISRLTAHGISSKDTCCKIKCWAEELLRRIDDIENYCL